MEPDKSIGQTAPRACRTPASSGATTSAGKKLATLITFRSSSPSPMPSTMMPPVAVSSAVSGSDQQDERVASLECHLNPKDRHEEAKTSANRSLEAGGDDAAQAQANRGAREHRAGVEGGTQAADHRRAGEAGRATSYSFSKRSKLTMKTVAPPTWTSTG